MTAIWAAIAVLRNNRGVWRQNINREGCIIFFYRGKVYSDDTYTYINNKTIKKYLFQIRTFLISNLIRLGS